MNLLSLRCIVVIILVFFVRQGYSIELPVDSPIGKQVIDLVKETSSQSKIIDFCQKEGIPFKPIGIQFIGNSNFCTLAYTSCITNESITKAGYSTKDTLSRLSQGWKQFELYRQQGLGDLLQPLFILALAPEGQRFLVRKGILRQKDASKFDIMMNGERQQTKLWHKKTSLSCLESKIAEYNIIAAPLAELLAKQWCERSQQ
ncbi:TPA: hypothetical protein H4C30_004144 [Escherichia coli]|uniref:hypothetical protein n=1 Tax=Escherichia coli TaxID=562 RepID=UPI0019A8FBC9|nr:hypothetical protein [Escherichia coli]